MVNKSAPLMFCEEFEKTVYNKLGNYVSKILFLGSSVQGGWVNGRSDIDIVVVLKRSGVESLIYKIYWYLDAKYGTNVLNAPFFHPPVMFVENKVEHVLLFTNLTPNKPPCLNKILKTLLYPFTPKIRHLQPWLTKHPRIANTISLLTLFPIRIITTKFSKIIDSSTSA